MIRRLACILAVLATASGALVGRASGSVIVLANYTDGLVQFTIAPKQAPPQAYQIVAGDVLPIPADEEVGIQYKVADQSVYHVLDPNAVYYFFRREQLELVRRGFDPPEATSKATKLAEPIAVDPKRRDAVGVIPVMLLVDEDEPAVQKVWEARLRQRLIEASAIFEHHCRVRFETVAVGTWESNDGLKDFALSLREFERKVPRPPEARLVIGFTSQYELPHGRTHLGGTRGPLHSHVLIREWSQHISYTERLEVLVHELGHILGASHSPDQNSVMRPLVGDRRSRARSFRIGFDPVNTLVLYTFGEQIRLRGVGQVGQFSPESRELLARVYGEMDKELPGDTSAAQYLAILRRTEPETLDDEDLPLEAATRRVVGAVAEAARRNQAQPPEVAKEPLGPSRLEGDRLTEYYFRSAASAAAQFPEEVARRAFVLGLGIAMDDSMLLRADATLGRLFRRIETPEERRQRLAVLGNPTMHGRRDLAQHFVVSSAIAALVGRFAAESAGATKEMSDARGTSGFSFADLSADIAGALFAEGVLKGKTPLAVLAERFTVADYLPPPDGLPEGLSEKAFGDAYGSLTDPRFQKQQAEIRRRILSLGGFAPVKNP